MYIVSITLITLGVILLLYVLMQILLLNKFRRSAMHGDRSAYVKILGEKFRCKRIHSDLYRYKWKKGIFVVKADFDHDGKQMGNNKITFRLFKRKPDKFLV